MSANREIRGFVLGVFASLVAAAIWSLWPQLEGEACEYFEGSFDEHKDPSVAEEELIEFVLSNEGRLVVLNLELPNRVIADLREDAEMVDGTKTYFLPLAAGGFLCGVAIGVSQDDSFFLSEGAANTGSLKGSFRVVGCEQTGTGWFDCELRALTVGSAGACS